MSLRHQLASLLVGYDVERFRREHDEALVRLGDLIDTADTVRGSEIIVIDFDAYHDAIRFLDTIPVGAVARARERLAK